jgi:hypothetical protein
VPVRTDRSRGNLKSKYARTYTRAISCELCRIEDSVLITATSGGTELKSYIIHSFLRSVLTLASFIDDALSRNISISSAHLERSSCQRAEGVSLILHKFRYNYFVKLIVQRLNGAPDS